MHNNVMQRQNAVILQKLSNYSFVGLDITIENDLDPRWPNMKQCHPVTPSDTQGHSEEKRKTFAVSVLTGPNWFILNTAPSSTTVYIMEN